MNDAPVIIVGAGVAGAFTGLLLARQGIPVLVVDRKAGPTDYKQLCTHFVQPAALTVIRKLGLEADFHRLGVATRAAMWSGEFWIDPPGDYLLDSSDGDTEVAFNIERRLLDPFLFRRLEETPDCSVRLDCRFLGAQPRPEGGWTVQLGCGDRTHPVRTRLLIGADGRQSGVASALELPVTFQAPNERACLFAFFDQGGAVPGDRSLFMHDDGGMAFLYPESEGRLLLCAFTRKNHEVHKAPRERKAALLLDMFRRLPHGVDLSRAKPVSPVHGYLDYPNRRRPSFARDAALVGDAALSLDPMSGVGCCFAMLGADMLAEAIAPVLRGNDMDFVAALETYASGLDREIGPHIKGICADSLIAKSPATAESNFRLIARDEGLQRSFMALTGRLQSPAAFQRLFLRVAARQAAAAHEPVADLIG